LDCQNPSFGNRRRGSRSHAQGRVDLHKDAEEAELNAGQALREAAEAYQEGAASYDNDLDTLIDINEVLMSFEAAGQDSTWTTRTA